MSNQPPQDPNQPSGGWPQQEGWQQPPTQPGTWQQPAVQPGQTPAMPYAPAPGAGNPFDDRSTPILVTGILSLVLCGPIGIYAWIAGNKLRDEAAAAGWPEPGTAKVGRILGIVGTIIGIAQVVFGILWVVLFFGILGTAAAGS